MGGKKKENLYGCNLTRKDRIKGGKSANKDIQRLRRIAHLGFLRRTRRKVRDPKGELMFNDLEKKVANTLLKNGVKYEYEEVIKVGRKRMIPDLIIKGSKTVIECTTWTCVSEKARRLKEKAKALLNSGSIDRVIVVTDNNMKEKYESHLKDVADVVTLREVNYLMRLNRSSL